MDRKKEPHTLRLTPARSSEPGRPPRPGVIAGGDVDVLSLEAQGVVDDLRFLRHLRILPEEMVGILAERVAEALAAVSGERASRVPVLVRIIAYCADKTEAESDLLSLASSLHDIGKLAVPPEILRKPFPLTHDERRTVELHAFHGLKMLSQTGHSILDVAAWIAFTHHERWDGTGYPLGLKGNEIPFAGRVTAVADVYDALTSDRPHRRAYPGSEARAVIEAAAGTLFDPAIVGELGTALDLLDDLA